MSLRVFMKRIILASHNEHKIEELQQILQLDDFKIVGLKELGFYDEIEENGKSFIENAVIKAVAIFNKIKDQMTENDFIVADDSGLSCDLLDGAPGIFSARFAAELSKEEKNKLLVRKLSEQSADQSEWTAHYTAAICIIDKSASKCIFEDYCYGKIVSVARGEHGFGFDPIFYLEEYSSTMAELTSEVKNKISHRAKACAKLRQYLINYN